MFTSVLPEIHRDSLEKLLFFNSKQDTISDALLSAIERFGKPRIKLDDGLLRVSLDSGIDAQTLFALDASKVGEQLAGIIVYVRVKDKIAIPFVAVDDDYTIRGVRANMYLCCGLVNEVIRIARCVKGVSSVSLYTRGVEPVRIPVN